MSGDLRFAVNRGMAVLFSKHRDEKGAEVSHEQLRGTVLDKGPNGPEWWVMPQGGGRAVVVKTADCQPASRLHRG